VIKRFIDLSLCIMGFSFYLRPKNGILSLDQEIVSMTYTMADCYFKSSPSRRAFFYHLRNGDVGGADPVLVPISILKNYALSLSDEDHIYILFMHFMINYSKMLLKSPIHPTFLNLVSIFIPVYHNKMSTLISTKKQNVDFFFSFCCTCFYVQSK
jgi:hypothetical protein